LGGNPGQVFPPIHWVFLEGKKKKKGGKGKIEGNFSNCLLYNLLKALFLFRGF